ncbi:MAG: N-acetyltransferase [Acidobacteriia bacterium]|nr:N-acetyltransferase [Terriglobia bacterium]
MKIDIRDETPADWGDISTINRLAFHGDEEAELVGRLRASGLVIASLVAIEGGRAVGHILFSDLPIEAEGGMVRAAGLAPMAVAPQLQRQGIGSALVRRGLDVCRERGISIVIVVGHPAYYPRFGFSSEAAKNLRAPFSGEAFMALELEPGALRGVRGTVRYPAAFGL